MRNQHAAGEAQDRLDFSRSSDTGAQGLLWSRGLSAPLATSAAFTALAATATPAPPVAFADPSGSSATAGAGKPGDHSTQYGIDRTVRFNIPVFTGAPGTSTFTNQDINGILGGRAWGASATAQTLTFSFPTSSTNYGPSASYGDPTDPEPAPYNGFQVLTDAQKNVVRYALGLIHSYTLLSFTETTETDTAHATLRYAGSSSPGTSYAYGPANRNVDGDAFFGNIRNSAPTKAGYAFDTFMHEIGHQMGLKHGQDQDTDHVYNLLPAAHNSTEWSIMTYYSYVGTPSLSYTNVEGSGNQTYMLDDIAALQYLYGANFTTNSGTTVYTWSPTTGEMFINGVGQGASSQNKVYETIWDGGGTDTYDLSNYTTGLTIDLRPGEWSTFSKAQLADLDNSNPGQHLAHGNLANAHLYNNDLRSLIEIAKGGSGADTLIGNLVGNTLYGGGGADTLKGMEGGDFLFGDAGPDTLIGGPGFDQMTGGADADTFSQYAGDSPIASPDLILDFQRGLDKLDVSGIGGGRVALTHNAAGTQTTVNYHYSGGAYTEAVLATGDVEGPDIVGDIGMSFYITGSSQPDTLIGGAGDDFIQGGDGADRIRGGLGRDTLTGNGGADVFELDNGESPLANPDVVIDFTLGTDKIGVFDPYTTYVTLQHTSATSTEVRIATSQVSDSDKLVINAFLTPSDITGNRSFFFKIIGSTLGEQLDGTNLADTIDGGGGADAIRGGLGGDRLTGGAGADVFNQFTGDSIIGSQDMISDFSRGEDILDVRGIVGGAVKIRHDITVGRSYVDYHLVSGNYTEEVIAVGDVEAPDVRADSGVTFDIIGGAANEGLIGGDAADTINGGGGDDVIRGGLGADKLTGGAGADTFNMFSGESTLLYSDTVSDFQHGVDNINLIGIPGGKVGLNHLNATTTEVYYHYNGSSYDERVIVTGDVEAPDVVADAGTAFRIVGFSTGETLTGGDGADSIDGGGGADTISGGLGVDTINGGAGNDIIRGGQGADVLTGGADADVFNMFIGESTLVFSDTITDFQHGVDHINVQQIPGGRVGLNHVSATQTEVYYSYSGSSYGERVIATGDVEAQDVQADAGTAFRIVGSSTAETLSGGDAGDSIDGGGGDDILRGGLGADILTGGAGVDTFDMYAGESLSATYDTITDFQRGVDKIDVRGISGGSVLLYHSAGRTDVAYHLVSGSYTETVGATGDVEGADVVASTGVVIVNYGYGAAETLVGGSGSDVFYGNGGADTLTGGAGVDTFVYQSLSDSTASVYDTITDFTHATDKIDLSAVSGGLVGLFHNDAGNVGVGFGYTSDGFSSVIFSTGDVEADDVYTAAGAQFYIVGGGLAETLVGSAGSDTIQGNGGADTIVGGGGFDYLTGGDGADTFKYLTLADSNLSAYDIIADFTSGTDKLDLSALSGSFINLVADGAGGAYAFYGFSGGSPGGVVHTIGAIQAADVIAAPGATFYLSGSAANDLLVGGGGADTLEGGGGQDTLYGGGGADVFKYSTIAESTQSAPDYVGDFQHGVDKIDFTGMGAGAVTISHPGYGGSFVYFAPNGSSDFGFVGVLGDVEAADLLVAAGVTVTVSGAFSGPEDHAPTADIFHPN